ncbi:MAG: N4-gp56 family major capsid protein [Anaerovoracaceae bacterium]
MATTKLTNLINPEVMKQMISAGLPSAIKFAPLANIDKTLATAPGNTITVPAFRYIGDAEDVAEGVAIGITTLETTSKNSTVKKIGKGVELTDESVLSGLGDPVGEAQRQIKMSIAAKIDNDCVEALNEATLTHDGSTAVIGYEGIVDAVGKFEEEDDRTKYLFIHPNQADTLRKDANFMSKDKYPLETVMSGAIGSIAGCVVVKSKKVKAVEGVYQNPIVKESFVDSQDGTKHSAITIYLKREVSVEDGRDILRKTTVITGDEHYVVALSDESMAVLAKFKK